MDMKSTAFMAALLIAASAPAFGQTGAPAGPPGGDASAPQTQQGRMGMYGGQGGHPHMRGNMHGDGHGMYGDHHGMQGGAGMMRGGMMHGMRFPPGYEKLEMEMHAEMMESMARILRKYAAQLPDKPTGVSP